MTRFLLSALLAASVASAQNVNVTDAEGRTVALTPADTARVLTLGGPVTEIVYALGAGSRVIAADSSSYSPDAVNKLPKVGLTARPADLLHTLN
ncbi:hypothetical protein K7W42_19620 [Deinococcus sp. HMF7604]|uniref:hypothetical protein n=1 Tax=Deinococcus betulae TaxID=2873312 RepID=UPI001CCB7C51|nr:hypothetical protein [Deinococcus betulae]MBZ9753050.1 hypothetical protein [Deinococcus betulae]